MKKCSWCPAPRYIVWMRRFIVCGFLGLFLIAGCTSAPKKVVSSATSAPRVLIFPYGQYQHQVHVGLKGPAGKGPREMDFQGAFTFGPDQIVLIALSGFGTTVFKVEENVKTQEISIKTYVPALEKFEPKIRSYYLILREVLTSPLQPPADSKIKVLAKNPQGLPSEIEFPGDKGAVKAILKSFDDNDVPKSVLITHPDFDLDVTVQGYEI